MEGAGSTEDGGDVGIEAAAKSRPFSVEGVADVGYWQTIVEGGADGGGERVAKGPGPLRVKALRAVGVDVQVWEGCDGGLEVGVVNFVNDSASTDPGAE